MPTWQVMSLTHISIPDFLKCHNKVLLFESLIPSDLLSFISDFLFLLKWPKISFLFFKARNFSGIYPDSVFPGLQLYLSWDFHIIFLGSWRWVPVPSPPGGSYGYRHWLPLPTFVIVSFSSTFLISSFIFLFLSFVFSFLHLFFLGVSLLLGFF